MFDSIQKFVDSAQKFLQTWEDRIRWVADIVSWLSRALNSFPRFGKGGTNASKPDN